MEMILEQCKEMGLKHPDFEQKDIFKVTFWRNTENDVTPVDSQNTKHDSLLIFNGLDDIIEYLNDKVTNKVSKVSNIMSDNVSPFACLIIRMLEHNSLSKKEILDGLNLSNQTTNKERHIDPLLSLGWIAYTVPDKINYKYQKYQLTTIGEKVLTLIKDV